MSLSPRDGRYTEVQPLRGPTAGDEPPRSCGSHADKPFLLPFILTFTLLGYYGSQGIQSFNIYEQGEKQAKQLCSPLAEPQNQCEEEFKPAVSKAYSVVQGPAAIAVLDSTKAVSSLQQLVVDACDAVNNGLDKCDIAENSVSKLKLAHLSNIPALTATSAQGSDVHQDLQNMKEDSAAYVDALTSACDSISKDMKTVCTQTDEAITTASAKVQKGLGALTHDAPAHVEHTMMEAVEQSSSAICPALGDLPKACNSLTQAATNALKDVEASADAALPKEVPRNVLVAALDEAEKVATESVRDRCRDAADVAKDCQALLSESQWRPVVAKVRMPLESLREQLQETGDMFTAKVSGRCDDVTAKLQEACSDLSDAAGAVASQIPDSTDADFEKKLSDLAQDLRTQLISLHDTLARKFSTIENIFKSMLSGCSTAGMLVKAQCNILANASTSFSGSAHHVQSSFASVSEIGAHSLQACNQIKSLQESCLAVANPAAILAKGTTGLWQHRSTEIVQLELYLLLGGAILAILMLGLVRFATKTIVIISVCLNLLGILSTAALNFMVMNIPGAILFGMIFLLKVLWFWCMRQKLEFAVTLIHTSVEAVERIMGIGVWLFSLLLIAIQAGVLVLSGGAWYFLMGPNAPPEVAHVSEVSPLLIPTLLVFSCAWTLEVLGNVLHVTICCSLGSACGVDTPAKSTCGSFCFAITGGLGSICLGSLLIAILKALQYLYEKGTNSKNVCAQIVVRIACCALQWILKLFNAYAFVFVGLKGSSYCEAAHKTADVFKNEGAAAIVADEALHDVVNITKMVSMWTLVFVSLICGHALDLIAWSDRSWQEALSGPILCVCLALLTSYALTLTMGRLLEASVCTLFIIFDDSTYKQCLKNSSQSNLYYELQKATESPADKPQE